MIDYYHSKLNDAIVTLYEKNWFACQVMMRLKRVETHEVPTLGVRFNRSNMQYELLWNPNFVDEITASGGCKNVVGVLLHEIYHIVLGHCTMREHEPHIYWNIATDRAINSVIDHFHKEASLPEKCINQKNFPIPNTPELLASEEYFDLLKDDIHKYKQMQDYLKKKIQDELNDGQGSSGGSQSDMSPSGFEMPSHEWNDIPEADRTIADTLAREIARQAAEQADMRSNGWGNTPAELRKKIIEYANVTVDWKVLFQYLIGNVSPYNRRNSLKRINKKYPYIHPGQTKNRLARILVAIDQSGSVDDESLGKAFSVLDKLTKKTEIDIVHFDSEVNESSLRRFSRGSRVRGERTRSGGTSFDAPSNYAAKRGTWDALIIITDGECSRPVSINMRRMWVIVPNCKLMFDTDEPVIQMR